MSVNTAEDSRTKGGSFKLKPSQAHDHKEDDTTLPKRLLTIACAVMVGIILFLLPAPAGLGHDAQIYISILAVFLILFLTEPLPLPIIMVMSAISLVAFGIDEVRNVWAAYADPVVFFVMGSLMIAIVVEKVGLTDRLGRFILRYTGTNVVKFSFVSCMGFGLASSVMHDVAACAVGITAMLPLIKAAGIKPYSRTGAFLFLTLPFCSSAGGMGTLVGGGRNMVAAAFLKNITGIDVTFGQLVLYAFPVAVVCIAAVWFALYVVFRPDLSLHFRPLTKEQLKKKPFSPDEKKTLAIVLLTFLGFFTKTWHGMDYSIIVMSAVVLLVLFGLIDWKTLSEKTEWAVPVLVFGGGIALGSAMSSSGAADFLANIFFPLFGGRGWLMLMVGVGLFAALITQTMSNTAATALIIPITIPIAIKEGVNPIIIALTIGMWTSFSFLLVMSCPPNVLAYSYGYFRPSQMAKAGLLAMPAAMIMITLTAITWWRIVGLV